MTQQSKFEETVVQPKLPFSYISLTCSRRCMIYSDGSVWHLPPCRACRRAYKDHDGKIKVVWLKEYIQTPALRGKPFPVYTTRRAFVDFMLAIRNNEPWLPSHLLYKPAIGLNAKSGNL